MRLPMFMNLIPLHLPQNRRHEALISAILMRLALRSGRYVGERPANGWNSGSMTINVTVKSRVFQ